MKITSLNKSYFAVNIRPSLALYGKLECGPMPNLMTAQPNIGGALCESSVITFLVPRCKVWLSPAA